MAGERITNIGKMKRYLIPILIVLVLASVSCIGCAQTHKPIPALKEDNPSWNEAQVIDHLYAYLTSKAEQVGGFETELGKMRISAKFQQVVVDALLETIRDSTKWPPSEQVYLECYSIPVYVDTTKRLAGYNGSSWWMVTIEGQWLVNERTGEVKAENEAAKQLLRDITHNSEPSLIFRLSDMVNDSYYWNSSWDADSLYRTLISTNRLYHQDHTYVKGVSDCDDMAIDIWNILYNKGITSVIVVGNLDIDEEGFTKSNHAWLLVMHKDTGYRIFIIETTNGETYVFDPKTMDFAQYLQGYFFASPSDLKAGIRERW